MGVCIVCDNTIPGDGYLCLHPECKRLHAYNKRYYAQRGRLARANKKAFWTRAKTSIQRNCQFCGDPFYAHDLRTFFCDETCKAMKQGGY